MLESKCHQLQYNSHRENPILFGCLAAEGRSCYGWALPSSSRDRPLGTRAAEILGSLRQIGRGRGGRRRRGRELQWWRRAALGLSCAETALPGTALQQRTSAAAQPRLPHRTEPAPLTRRLRVCPPVRCGVRQPSPPSRPPTHSAAGC